MRAERPVFVTAIATSGIAEGWRGQRRAGGVVLDVATGETVSAALSMPHSPRWHRDTPYCLQAGTGKLGRIDLATGRFEVIGVLPGFARGLAFIGAHAVVGLSLPRNARAFTGLPLDDQMRDTGVMPCRALAVIDLMRRDLVHSLAIEGVIAERFDVAVIARRRNPAMIGFRSDEVRRVVTICPLPGLTPGIAPGRGNGPLTRRRGRDGAAGCAAGAAACARPEAGSLSPRDTPAPCRRREAASADTAARSAR